MDSESTPSKKKLSLTNKERTRRRYFRRFSTRLCIVCPPPSSNEVPFLAQVLDFHPKNIVEVTDYPDLSRKYTVPLARLIGNSARNRKKVLGLRLLNQIQRLPPPLKPIHIYPDSLKWHALRGKANKAIKQKRSKRGRHMKLSRKKQKHGKSKKSNFMALPNVVLQPGLENV